MNWQTTMTIALCAALTGCGGGGASTSPEPVTTATTNAPTATAAQAAAPVAPVVVPNSPLDDELRAIINEENLTEDPTAGRNLPDITSARASLGMALFYSTNLGGENEAACVSCHHPALGGADALSLSVGVNPVNVFAVTDVALLGPGRHPAIAGGFPLVPRNAPTTFNSGLWDRAMFWDSRVASTTPTPGTNGIGTSIITPDSPDFNTADSSLPANASLPAAQARFPVTSEAEMRGEFAAGDDNQSLRAQLAARFAGDANWETLFELAYGDGSPTFDRIADAIGEYERSQSFVDTPWHSYVAGDNDAISEAAKAGAVLFFTAVDDGGAGCSRCHNGDTFSDGRHHIVAFPQVSDDIGREAISGDVGDRYHFRTPSLLNIAVTGPYGHSGLYETLEQVVDHYDNPRGSVDTLFGEQGNTPFVQNAPVCNLPQITRAVSASGSSCETLLTDAFNNSQLALNRLNNDDANNPLGPRPNLNGGEVSELVAFLESLTDPCVQDRDCLDPWIVDADDVGTFPDASPVIAHDEDGRDL